jgi:hypothetical protein
MIEHVSIIRSGLSADDAKEARQIHVRPFRRQRPSSCSAAAVGAVARAFPD